MIAPLSSSAKQSDVQIVISGIQNPRRREIRDKAMEMGAKYSADWNRSSTHLLCPFQNTPKLREVKGRWHPGWR